MPGPLAAQILQMPHTWDWQGGQMPHSSLKEGGGGGGGAGGSGRSWNWLMHKLKAENFLSQMQSTYKYITKND